MDKIKTPAIGETMAGAERIALGQRLLSATILPQPQVIRWRVDRFLGVELVEVAHA